jgi:hypothetical protein
MNAFLLWGFGAGDLSHGRLAEAYGLRLRLLLGSVGTAALNVVTSFAKQLLAPHPAVDAERLRQHHAVGARHQHDQPVVAALPARTGTGSYRRRGGRGHAAYVGCQRVDGERVRVVLGIQIPAPSPWSSAA